MAGPWQARRGFTWRSFIDISTPAADCCTSESRCSRSAGSRRMSGIPAGGGMCAVSRSPSTPTVQRPRPLRHQSRETAVQPAAHPVPVAPPIADAMAGKALMRRVRSAQAGTYPKRSWRASG
jgi:hypothetical protein